MKVNYKRYGFNRKERTIYLAESILLNLGINYLFYKSFMMSVILIPVSFLFVKYKKRLLMRERKRRLHFQFKDGLSSLSVALRAGYSLENAVSEAALDLKKMYREDQDLVKEFHYIANQIKVSVPLDTLFQDLANRSGIDDISNFASIISISRQMGGDTASILQNSARMLEEKIAVKKEIASTVAGKQMEQMVMSLVPIGIILYMQVTSPGFLDVLYGNLVGTVIMTVCLLVYLFSYLAGRKIVDIEV